MFHINFIYINFLNHSYKGVFVNFGIFEKNENRKKFEKIKIWKNKKLKKFFEIESTLLTNNNQKNHIKIFNI